MGLERILSSGSGKIDQIRLYVTDGDPNFLVDFVRPYLKLGYEVVALEKPEMLIKIVNEEMDHPGVFILGDFLDDGMKAKKLAREIRSITKEKRLPTAIYILTNFPQLIDKASALAEGADGYLVKGIDSPKIIRYQVEAGVRTIMEQLSFRSSIFFDATKANLDELTELFNRRGFEEFATRELRRASYYKDWFLYFLIDVDNFKGINDAYGHPTGDKVLKAVAERFRLEFLRPRDLIARMGEKGDEYVILVKANPREAGKIKSRLKKAVKKLKVETTNGEELDIDISVGHHAFKADKMRGQKEILDEALGIADKNMYVDKARKKEK